MVLDLIDVKASVEYRSEEAAITQVIAKDDSREQWAIMLWALVLL